MNELSVTVGKPCRPFRENVPYARRARRTQAVERLKLPSDQISNLPFVVVGAIALWQFGRDRASFVLFLGIFLTGFGSAYYHWNPKNDTLFWDRLPMALTFMAILAVAVEERLS